MQEINQHRNAGCQQCHYEPLTQGIVLHQRTGTGKEPTHFFCLPAHLDAPERIQNTYQARWHGHLNEMLSQD